MVQVISRAGIFMQLRLNSGVPKPKFVNRKCVLVDTDRFNGILILHI